MNCCQFSRGLGGRDAIAAMRSMVLSLSGGSLTSTGMRWHHRYHSSSWSPASVIGAVSCLAASCTSSAPFRYSARGLHCNSIQGKTTEFCFRSRVCQPRDEPIALVGHDGLILMVLCWSQVRAFCKCDFSFDSCECDVKARFGRRECAPARTESSRMLSSDLDDVSVHVTASSRTESECPGLARAIPAYLH